MVGRKAWLWALLAPVVLCLAVGSQAVYGQDNPKVAGEKPLQKETPDKQQGERAGWSGKSGAEFGEYTDLIKELGLTEEQQDKLASLILYRAVLGRYQGTVPSPASRDKSKVGAAEQPPDPLQLTDAQKEKIKALCADAVREAAVADDKGKGRGAAADKVMQAVRDQVLTAEQKNALAAGQIQQRVMGRVLAGLSGKGNDALKLSGQQLAQIKAICENAARGLDPNADEKGNLDAFQKVAEEVKAVLTPEQREELTKRMESRAGGKEGKGGDAKQPPGDDGGKGK